MSPHPHHSPPCDDLIAQLSDYIDGELEDELCAELEAHLVDCQNCKALFDITRKTVILYRRHYQESQVPLSDEVMGRLRQALSM
jgi:anti-sigma factor (TIGR02949 family)